MMAYHSSLHTQDVVDPAQSKYLSKGIPTFNFLKGLAPSSLPYGIVDPPRNSPPHQAYLSKPQTMVHDRQPRSQQHWNHPRQGYGTHPSSPNDVMIYEPSLPPHSESTHEATNASASYYSADPASPTFSIDDISSIRASSSTETLQSTLLAPPTSTINSPSGTFYRMSSSTCNPDVYSVASDRPSNPVNQGQRQQTKSSSDDPRSIHAPAPAKSTASTSPPERRPSAMSVSRRSSPDNFLASSTSASPPERRPSVPSVARRSSPDNFSLASSTSSSPPSSPEPIHEFPAQIDTGRFQIVTQGYAEFPSEGVEQYTEYAQSYYPHPKGSQYVHPYESSGYVERSAESVAPLPFRTRTVSRRSRSMSTTVRPSLQVEVPARRCVRWKDGLVCDSPIPRRKGWFNRRGDQLWTNDGLYKPVEPGQEYPEDLANYPDPTVGWMNEIGVVINHQRRMIPKTPPRSALKRLDTHRRATV